MNTSIDTPRIHATRLALETELRAVKAELCTRWTRPMATQQRRALALARDLTSIYALLAHSRGRSHLADAERSRELAEALAPRFALPILETQAARHGLG